VVFHENYERIASNADSAFASLSPSFSSHSAWVKISRREQVPIKYLQKVSGVILFVLSIVVAAVAWFSHAETPNPAVIPAIIGAGFGMIVGIYAIAHS
jgi:hypothetical protein